MLPQRSFGTATVTLWGRHGFSDHRPCDWLFKVHSSHNENIKFYNTLTLVSKIGCWRVDCPKRGPQVNAPVMQGSFPCHNSFMRLQVCIQNGTAFSTSEDRSDFEQINLFIAFTTCPTYWISLGSFFISWWLHQMVTGEFPSQRPVTRSFEVFIDLCLNKRLNTLSWGWF